MIFMNILGAGCLIFLALYSVRGEDKGFLRSCDPALYQFSMDWTPRTFQSGVTYTINLNAVAAKTFTSGKMCLKVWLHGIPDPIYDDWKPVECKEILTKAWPPINNLLKCPIAPGDIANVTEYKFTIDPTWPLPGGHFHLRATLDNENNEQFICVMGDIDIADDFDEDF